MVSAHARPVHHDTPVLMVTVRQLKNLKLTAVPTRPQLAGVFGVQILSKIK